MFHNSQTSQPDATYRRPAYTRKGTYTPAQLNKLADTLEPILVDRQKGRPPRWKRRRLDYAALRCADESNTRHLAYRVAVAMIRERPRNVNLPDPPYKTAPALVQAIQQRLAPGARRLSEFERCEGCIASGDKDAWLGCWVLGDGACAPCLAFYRGRCSHYSGDVDSGSDSYSECSTLTWATDDDYDDDEVDDDEDAGNDDSDRQSDSPLSSIHDGEIEMLGEWQKVFVPMQALQAPSVEQEQGNDPGHDPGDPDLEVDRPAGVKRVRWADDEDTVDPKRLKQEVTSISKTNTEAASASVDTKPTPIARNIRRPHAMPHHPPTFSTIVPLWILIHQALPGTLATKDPGKVAWLLNCASVLNVNVAAFAAAPTRANGELVRAWGTVYYALHDTIETDDLNASQALVTDAQVMHAVLGQLVEQAGDEAMVALLVS